MLVLVLQVLAHGALYPHWPVKISQCTVESQGSWPMCAIRHRQFRMGEIQALTVHQAHNNVTEWRNESMEKTHNPHYKGFGISFYDTCDRRTIMYSLILSTSPQPVFWRLNLCSNNGISPSKQEHVRFLSLSLSLPLTLLSHSLSLLHYIRHQSGKLAHA